MTELSPKAVPPVGGLSPLQQLLLENEQNDDAPEPERQDQMQRARLQLLPRRPSRPGFAIERSLTHLFVRIQLGTKLVDNPCSLHFTITHEGESHSKEVFPMDCFGDFAHFRIRSYTRVPVRLCIRHRNIDGVFTTIEDKEFMREYVGTVNPFGKKLVHWFEKRFQLAFLPWRQHKISVLPWDDE